MYIMNWFKCRKLDSHMNSPTCALQNGLRQIKLSELQWGFPIHSHKSVNQELTKHRNPTKVDITLHQNCDNYNDSVLHSCPPTIIMLIIIIIMLNP